MDFFLFREDEIYQYLNFLEVLVVWLKSSPWISMYYAP